MANDATKVRVGKPLATGGILIAPTGSVLPTDNSTAPDVAFVACGFIGDGGVTQSIATDVQEIKAWGGDTVRKIQTSHDLTYQFRMIETTDVTLKKYYGDGNVTTALGITTVKINSTELGHDCYLLEVDDGGDRVRVVIPDGQITDRGDIVFQDADVVGYDVTVTCYPDTDGNKAYLYSGTATP